MIAEINKVAAEWDARAKADLASAELILRGSKYFDISAYHSHQAIEKTLKAGLIKKGVEFKYIHDLEVLLKQLLGPQPEKDILEKIIYVSSLYPILRYPEGEDITEQQAELCLKTAKEILAKLGINK